MRLRPGKNTGRYLARLRQGNYYVPMGKLFFALAYAASAVVPGLLYLIPLGSPLGDPYGVSVLLGAAAFAVLTNQFLLASRPAPVIAALGLKPLLAFHGTMAAVGLLLAGGHLTLKILVLGYPRDTFQAKLGAAALTLFLLASLLAVLLMATTFWMRIPALKRLREGVYKKLGLTYRKMRAVHNSTVVAGVLVLFHVLLASSSDFLVNPAAVLWVVLWTGLCLGAYFRYRLRRRNQSAKAAGEKGT